jgi:hypothetical protein
VEFLAMTHHALLLTNIIATKTINADHEKVPVLTLQVEVLFVITVKTLPIAKQVFA